MKTARTVAELRAQIGEWRGAGKRIGFVPTMGNLHAGHFSLIRQARESADKVVASIFVNPSQFGPNEDFDRYPRTPDADAERLDREGCDLLFLPSVDEMYPLGVGSRVRMDVPSLTGILCGASRPGHFDGVCTVVSRLFNQVQQDVAVFGQKDYQQLAILRHMVRDLAFPIDVQGAPTSREADGLAMSSRNQYLTPEQRAVAPLIQQTLHWLAGRVAAGEGIVATLQAARARLADAGFEVDYVAVRRADLAPATEGVPEERVALAAAKLGNTRLIDNLVFVPAL